VSTPSIDGFSETGEDEEERPVELRSEPERRFGKYTLVYRIASGGMATVYLGREQGPHGFDRPVAIKRIHPHLQTRRAFVDMFLDEARIAARINHPNVCTVLDFGAADETYYIALEYLVGVPLHRLISVVAHEPQRLRSPKWQALAARIIADACEGLHAAHELRDGKGEPLHVVHRDVSPQNLFVTFDGVVKVVDFGVARSRARLHQTATGTVKGKLSYMAPEHAVGGTIDRRADVWSLGVCLWEALTGRRLFKRKNEMEVILAIREGSIPRLSALVPDIPPMLEEIVVQALERDVELRFPTTRALGVALQTYLKSQPDATGLAELAEWMSELFARERIERMGMLSATLDEDESRARPVERVPYETLSAIDVAEAPTQAFETGAVRMPSGPPGAPDSGPAIAIDVPSEESAPVFDAKTDPAPRPPYRWIAIGAAAFVGLVLLGVALGVAIGGDREPEIVTRELGLPPPERARSGGETRVVPIGVPDPVPAPEPPALEPEIPPAFEPAMAEVATMHVAAHPDRTVSARLARPPGASEDDRASMVETRSVSAMTEAHTPEVARPETAMETATETAMENGRATGEVIVVAVGGWADVYVNGQRAGRTPARLRLPAGRATIVLRPSGGETSIRRPVTVRAGDETRLVVDVR
jgi:serine/threonine-protein kinase